MNQLALEDLSNGWAPANRLLRRIAAELDRFESVDLNTLDEQELIDFLLEWEYFRAEVSRFEFLFANRLRSLDYALTG